MEVFIIKILVTGGAGFIGSHLIHKLHAANKNFFVVDNLSSGRRENLPKNINFIAADIGDDLNFILEEKNFDAIVHLAAQTAVSNSIKNPLFDSDANIGNTIKILEFARKNNVKRIIFASSAAVYGDVNIFPTPENFQAAPTSFYGLSKLTAENYIKLYQKFFGIDYVILRFANVFGERQGNFGEGGVISIFAKKIAADENIKIFGDGLQTRDFIHAGDIADGIICALNTENKNSVYNLSGQTSTNLLELVKIFKIVSEKNFEVEHESERDGDIRHSLLSNQNAKKFLNWSPKIPIFYGIRRTYNYFSK